MLGFPDLNGFILRKLSKPLIGSFIVSSVEEFKVVLSNYIKKKKIRKIFYFFKSQKYPKNKKRELTE